MWVRLGTNTQGTFDSPRMWRDISDEALIVKGKFTRSAAESCVFHRRIDGGLLVIGKNVDDIQHAAYRVTSQIAQHTFGMQHLYKLISRTSKSSACTPDLRLALIWTQRIKPMCNEVRV